MHSTGFPRQSRSSISQTVTQRRLTPLRHLSPSETGLTARSPSETPPKPTSKPRAALWESPRAKALFQGHLSALGNKHSKLQERSPSQEKA